MTTLLVLYRRPDGGPEAIGDVRASLRAGTPAAGRRRPRACARRVIRRVSGALGGETDLVLVAAMTFDDRARLDAGLASDAMRAAGRNLARHRPGSGDAPRPRGCPGDDRSRFRRVWILSHHRAKEPSERRPDPAARTATPRPASGSRARPAAWRWSRSTASGAQRAVSFDLLDDARRRARPTLDADPRCRAIVLTGAGARAFAAGADISELATQTSASLREGASVRGLGSDRRGRAAADRGGRAASPSAAAASWR